MALQECLLRRAWIGPMECATTAHAPHAEHLDLLTLTIQIGALHGNRQDGSGLHVGGMLDLVRQMRPPVLHLRNAGVRVVGMFLLFVRSFLRSLSVQSVQVCSRTASFSVVLACPFSFGRRSVFGEIATKCLIDRRRVLE